jgi:hypothetical protein
LKPRPERLFTALVGFSETFRTGRMPRPAAAAKYASGTGCETRRAGRGLKPRPERLFTALVGFGETFRTGRMPRPAAGVRLPFGFVTVFRAWQRPFTQGCRPQCDRQCDRGPSLNTLFMALVIVPSTLATYRYAPPPTPLAAEPPRLGAEAERLRKYSILAPHPTRCRSG